MVRVGSSGEGRSWWSRLKARLTSSHLRAGDGAAGGPDTVVGPTTASWSTLRTSADGPQPVHLPSLSAPRDKIDVARVVLEVIPPDEDYRYFDGASDRSSPARQLAHRLALEGFDNLPAEDPQCLHRLGFALLQLGDYPRALTCFQKQSEVQPLDGGTWDNLAWSHMKLGHTRSALACAEKAVDLLPDLPNVYDTHAAALRAASRLEDAIAVAETGIGKSDPPLPELLYSCGMLWEECGDIAAAIRYWRRFLDRAAGDYGLRGPIWRVLGKLSSHDQPTQPPDLIGPSADELVMHMFAANSFCRGMFAKLAEVDSAHADPKMWRDVGQLVRAIAESYGEILTAITPLCSDERRRWVLARNCNSQVLGSLLVADLGHVAGWLKDAAALVAKDPERDALAYAYYIMSVMEDADGTNEYDFLQEALHLHPAPCHAHILLGRYYCKLKEYDKVEALWKQVTSATGQPEGERALAQEARFGVSLWRGVSRIMQGQARDAIRILADLRKERPTEHAATFYLAVATLQTGNVKEAVDLFRSVPQAVLPEEVRRALSQPLVLSGVSERTIEFAYEQPRMSGCASSPLSCR